MSELTGESQSLTRHVDM